MNKIFVFIFLLTSIKTLSQEPNWLWAKNASSSDNDLGYAVKVDALGNVYVCGYFYGPTISFGNYTLVRGSAYTKVFIVKYDVNGVVQWAVAPDGEASSLDMAIDAAGNIYVCGSFFSSIFFDSNLLVSNGSCDGFIAKYDTSGNVIWAKRMGGTDVDFYNYIAADPNGNIVVTGSYFSTSVIIGNTTQTNSDNINDLLVVSFDTAGTFNWVRKYGGICTSQITDIDCDSSGNIAIAGFYFNSNINFDTLSITNAGERDGFIVLYNNVGNILWAKGVGSSEDDYGNAVTFDQNGNVILLGKFESQMITIDSTILSNSGLNDVFIISYNMLGSVNWAKKYGGTANEILSRICTDQSGNIYTLGSFDSPSIIWDADSVYNTGTGDMLINKFDSSGNLLWAKTSENTGTVAANDITIDASGNLYITGWYSSNLIYLDAIFFYNFGYADFFAGKLATLETGISSIALGNELNVYPNPSYDKLYIKTNVTGTAKSIILYDMFGRVLKEIPFTSSVTEIERAELPAGMYIIEIREKNVLKEFQKVILN